MLQHYNNHCPYQQQNMKLCDNLIIDYLNQEYHCSYCADQRVNVAVHFLGQENDHFYCRTIKSRLVNASIEYRVTLESTRKPIDDLSLDYSLMGYILCCYKNKAIPHNDLITSSFIYLFHLIVYSNNQNNEVIQIFLKMFYNSLQKTYFYPLLVYLISKQQHNLQQFNPSNLCLMRSKNYLYQFKNDQLFLNFLYDKRLLFKAFGCVDEQDTHKDGIGIWSLFLILLDVEAANLCFGVGLSDLALNSLESNRLILINTQLCNPFHSLINIIDKSIFRIKPPPNSQIIDLVRDSSDSIVSSTTSFSSSSSYL